ncbi:uncharacterized protein si:ch211-67e16.4 isoform X4 [Gadus morhua]|uniref:uncharacterized protein si:ch211-67e16.4 isoform X4 n=1 Tax=Gadus morhua TaxID=8049 RepID=UPI0011B4787E|nr:uncharacterized protein LOC115560979 isoform X4 [Gadus morhua]
MDVSIAVSLIRGQMGTVVEQAVNGAVETVLAEMLRIVGVKFEELKAQVAALQRDKAAVQREKSLKEKENDKIRAMLRYTELKLKYYRQGVEEEIQQRATTSSHPSSQNASPSSTARGLEPPPGETGPGSGLLDRTASENSQEDLHYSGDGHASVHEKEEEEDGDWIISLQSGMQSAAPSAGHAPFPADSSTLPCSTPPVQVKEEFPTFQEVLSIKEEPEEEQVGTLLLDCQGRPAHLLGQEGQQSEFSGGSMMQRNLPGHMSHGFNFPGSTSYSVAGSSLPVLLAHVPPRQAVRPWPKDLRLYEEYKLRRNELQRRSIDRRREREKSLPQPLLADLVRERREKTRLRVARWRAKRKLQAGLNQAQALGDAAPGFSQQNVRSRHPQQHPGRPSGGVVPSIRALPCEATSFLQSNMMPGNNNMMPSNSSMPRNMMPCNNMLPSNRFPAYISSSSSVFVGPDNTGAQHAVTSTSPNVPSGQSQHLSSLMDSHLFH